jgi:hypothetical protein
MQAYQTTEPDIRTISDRVAMNGIEKLDNVTWYGHCVVNFVAALNDLPDEAKLTFCRDLGRFIKRQERALRDAF